MSTMTTTPATPESLMSLPEDVFRRLVDSDLRGKGDSQLSRALRSEEVVDRWLSSLNGMSKSVEGQLAAKKADLEATTLELEVGIDTAEANGDVMLANNLRSAIKGEQQKEARWRAGIIRFKTGLEEVILEARRIRDSYQPNVFKTLIAEERNYLGARVRELEAAIREHRDHDCDQAGCVDDDCVADDILWSFVS